MSRNQEEKITTNKAGDQIISSDATPSAQIASEIRAAIFAGAYQPGERLNEAAISLKMNTSRGPIREAMIILAGLGLVEMVRNRGVFVREMSVSEMMEVSELRALLFGFAAESAAERRSEEEAQRLIAIVDEMERAVETQDRDRYYELNLAFHSIIIALTHNTRAALVYDGFTHELHLFRRRDFNHNMSMRTSCQEHRKVAQAVLDGDAKQAGDLARQHIHSGCQRMLRQMDRT